jgi:uncharacterized lipoprotein YmbA
MMKRRGFFSIGIAALLSGCGTLSKPPATYVLGSAPPATDSARPLIGRKTVYVQRALVPDYLDTTDIQARRAANEMVSSPTGRWGERLSVGITGALTADLARRLPDEVVTAERPLDPAWRQVLVNVETFEAHADGTVVLVARWRVADGDTIMAGQRVSLTDQAGGTGDAAVVAAMSRLVDRLADPIASALAPVTPLYAPVPQGHTSNPRQRGARR